MSLSQIKKEILKLANPQKAKILQRFFKTAKGEYGEGDVFLGMTVPISRTLASEFWDKLTFDDLQELLNSKFHEERLIALLILIKKYDKEEGERKRIFDFYLKNYKNINNWDLVDLSAPNIVGNYLLDKNRKILYEFSLSDDLWKKRIAIISTFTFIRNCDFEDTIKMSKILLNDKHDLIHKAVGWMLREVGKRDLNIEENFLKKHYKTMPRTMLRYAIEKFEETKRQKYLAK